MKRNKTSLKFVSRHHPGDVVVEHGRDLGIERILVLTFETSFFARHGFREIEGTPVTPEVYTEMRRSYDRGIAEFLDLEYVKPNTLGNTRMLLTLQDA